MSKRKSHLGITAFVCTGWLASQLFVPAPALAAPPAEEAPRTLGEIFSSFLQIGARTIADLDPSARLQEAWSDLMSDSSIQSLVNDPMQSLMIVAQANQSGVETMKYQHYYKGIEVLGSMAFHHRNVAQGAHKVRDRLRRFDLSAAPAVSAEDAVAIARAAADYRELEAKPELKILPDSEGQGARLIYWVGLSGTEGSVGRDVLVDAHSGKIIANVSHELSIAPVEVHTAQGAGMKVSILFKVDDATQQPSLTGCALTDAASGQVQNIDIAACQDVLSGKSALDAGKCQIVFMDLTDAGAPETGMPILTNPAACPSVVSAGVVSADADASARRAADNATRTLNYYQSVHGRDSYDGKGSVLVSVVHAGIQMQNAFWDTSRNIMDYGDGDGVEMGDLTLAVDVAGHEMTHGVTAQTAKLLNFGESGSLNEGNSDFFGKMIENQNDWRMGRAIALPTSAQVGFRDLADPHATFDVQMGADGSPTAVPFPATLGELKKAAKDEECGGDNDACYAHFNSTIYSHGAYLVLQAIGREKAEKLYYLTLTQFLNATATLAESGKDVRDACAHLYDSSVCDSVDHALAGMGL